MREIKIGNVRIRGYAALAPMASVADRAYREMCKQYGCAYLTSEMISSKGLVYGDKKTPKLCRITPYERPMAIQLFGEDPLYMAKAAEMLLRFSPDIIDVNMGCPVPKIVGNGAGSALMKNPKIAEKMVLEMVRAVDFPITVKLRSGWDEQSVNAIELSKRLEQAGAAAICVHARTRTQMYSGKADLEIIKKVKQSVNIPVIGNGDIKCGEDAHKMYSYTGCDLVAVGRASYGNPFVFAEINSYFEGKKFIAPTLEERLNAMRLHTEKIVEYKGERQGMKEARKNIAWYLKGLPGAAKLRNECGTLSALDELYDMIERILTNGEADEL
ncbi:MAG: tRNA dihydrouridine synthase DusB [Ruminococcus sp.]|nr:tRNA dihydrouridine synthase DusB [Ruminococcus sp.]